MKTFDFLVLSFQSSLSKRKIFSKKKNVEAVEVKLEGILSCEEIPIVRLKSYAIKALVIGYYIYKKMFNPLVNLRAFSLSPPIGTFSLRKIRNHLCPLIGTFSLCKIRNHLCTALLSSLYFSGFTLFEIRLLLYCSKVFFGTPKREATSLWGFPFSNSLSALYFILYDLFFAQRFVATHADCEFSKRR